MKILKTTAVLLVLAILANAMLFGLVWTYHEFILGLNPVLTVIVWLLVLLITIPAAIFLTSRLTRIFSIYGTLVVLP